MQTGVMIIQNRERGDTKPPPHKQERTDMYQAKRASVIAHQRKQYRKDIMLAVVAVPLVYLLVLIVTV